MYALFCENVIYEYGMVLLLVIKEFFYILEAKRFGATNLTNI